MSTRSQRLLQLFREDTRYKPEAYEFIRLSLAYAQERLHMGSPAPSEGDPASSGEQPRKLEPHLTGQQLCEASRRYALDRYGYMAKVVLNSWGLRSTSDFGEVVYNLIRIGEMKKSKTDRREDFDNVFDFDEAFQQRFEITMPE